jgi:tannase
MLGVDLLPCAITADPVYNVTVSGDSADVLCSCNITGQYTHAVTSDHVILKYTLPDQSSSKNRFYVGGGGCFSSPSDATGGLVYGVVGGATDAGYDSSNTGYDEAVLRGNDPINWVAMYMFGCQGLGEMTAVGKAITKSLYGLAQADKIYTYFKQCSDGGREGRRQVQRWGNEYDGIIVHAPRVPVCAASGPPRLFVCCRANARLSAATVRAGQVCQRYRPDLRYSG